MAAQLWRGAFHCYAYVLFARHDNEEVRRCSVCVRATVHPPARRPRKTNEDRFAHAINGKLNRRRTDVGIRHANDRADANRTGRILESR